MLSLLLRIGFWLGLILVLLPTFGSNEASSNSKMAQVSAGDAASAASATLSDMRQFCSRQPEVCAIGAQAAIALGRKAQAGAKIIYEFLNEQLGSQDNGALVEPSPRLNKTLADTLTPGDRAPAWRAPTAVGKETQLRPAT